MMASREIIDLNGEWKFRLDPNDLGEKFADQLNWTHKYDARWMGDDYDDSQWDKISVPSCWQTEGHDYNGVAWYRRIFPLPVESEHPEQQVLLRFEGVDYYADVWLNGHYLGSHEGYFGSFDFPVTPYLRDKNILCVRVDSPREFRGEEHEVGQLKNTFKGALERWDVNNPEVSPGGIWNDVKLISTGQTRIESLRATGHPLTFPSLGEPDTLVEALVAVEIDLTSVSKHLPLTAKLEVEVSPVNHKSPSVSMTYEVELVPGPQTMNFKLRMPEAKLWWTWDLGQPNLYNIHIKVNTLNEMSDEVETIFGIRQIERRNGWETFLNGVRFFQRGANYLSDQFLSLMSQKRYVEDVKLLKNANLNTVHPFCVIEKQTFYDACDKAGILVYQDFLIWLMGSNESDFVRRGITQLDELIKQFGNHPSIGIWTFGSQPSQANFEKLCSALSHFARWADPTRIINQANGAIETNDHKLDEQEQAEHSVRSFFWTWDYAEQVAQRYDWRYDTHFYDGWYSPDLTGLLKAPKMMLQLITEYGGQSFPKKSTLGSFIKPDKLFPPDKDQYARRGSQIERQLERVPLTENLDSYIAATQAHQAELVRYHTEFYRRHKFRPCNGAHVFCFIDCWPSISWSLVEYDRTPKEAYYALKQSMAPVQTLLDIFDLSLNAGQSASIPICIVNDTQNKYSDIIIRCEFTGEDGKVVSKDERGNVPATGIVDCDSINWTPEQAGKYNIKVLLLHESDILAENIYTILVSK
jgi:beta-mannosidase